MQCSATTRHNHDSQSTFERVKHVQESVAVIWSAPVLSTEIMRVSGDVHSNIPKKRDAIRANKIPFAH